MSALSAVQPLAIQGGVDKLGSHPVLTGIKIWKGGMVGITAAGYATIFATGLQFAGHATETVDNTAGSSGDVRVEVLRGFYSLTVPTFDSATIAHFGDAVGSSSDNHADLTRTTTDQVGVISDVNENGVVVAFKTADIDDDDAATASNLVGPLLNNVGASVAAAGTVQGDATALGTGIVQVVTAGDDSKGVILPTAAADGKHFVILNSGSAGLKIYPATGDKINNGSANAAITILENTTCTLWATAVDNWAAQYTVNS